MRAEELIQRIKLEGDADITAAFERISDAGTRAFDNLQQSLGQTPETFDKSISGAEKLGTEVGGLDTKFKNLLPTLQRLGGALGVIFGARELINLGETFDNINDRIRSVTRSVEEQEHVYQRLLDVSNNTRTSLEENTKSFQTFAVAMRNYGRSTDDAIIAQENLIRTVKLSGLDMSEASGIVSQLTRALAGGSTESYRFTQQLMRVPRLAQLIAESVGKSRDEILSMAEAGEISADVILNALTDQGVAAQELRSDFDNLRVTVGEAGAVIRNNLVNSIGRIENSVGIVENLARAAIVLSDNLEAVGAAMLVIFGPAMYRRVLAMFALLRAHPFVAIASALAAIVGYVHNVTNGFKDWDNFFDRLLGRTDRTKRDIEDVRDTVDNTQGSATRLFDATGAAANRASNNIQTTRTNIRGMGDDASDAVQKINKEIADIGRDAPTLPDFNDMQRRAAEALSTIDNNIRNISANSRNAIKDIEKELIELKRNEPRFTLEPPVRPLTPAQERARERETDRQRQQREYSEAMARYNKEIEEYNRARAEHQERIADHAEKIAEKEEQQKNIQEQAAKDRREQENERAKLLQQHHEERIEAERNYQEQMEQHQERLLAKEEEKAELLERLLMDRIASEEKFSQEEAKRREQQSIADQERDEALTKFIESQAEVRTEAAATQAEVQQQWGGLIQYVIDRINDLEEVIINSIGNAFSTAKDLFSAWLDVLTKGLQRVIDLARDAAGWLSRIAGGGAPATEHSHGGLVFSAGGPVWGAGTATSDSIPAYLSSGEYVIRAAAVRRYGQRLFDLLNNMRVSPDMFNFNMGGLVSLRHLEATGANNGPSSTLNLTIGDEVFENLIAPRETARRLERFATRKQLSSAGRKPGWYS